MDFMDFARAIEDTKDTLRLQHSSDLKDGQGIVLCQVLRNQQVILTALHEMRVARIFGPQSGDLGSANEDQDG